MHKSSKKEVVNDVQETAPEPSLGDSLMRDVLSKPRHGEAREIAGIVLGRVADAETGCPPTVVFPGAPGDAPLPAASTVELSPEDKGCEVALSFVGGDPARPLILGRLNRSVGEMPVESSWDVQVDDERLVLDAEKEIVLRCGKSSITLTRAGKIILRGEYLSSHASGVNRIKGGSVQVN